MAPEHLKKALEFIHQRQKEKRFDPNKNGHHIDKSREKTRSNYNQLQARYPLITDEAGLKELVETLKETTGDVGIDIETYPQDETARSLDPRRGRVGAISLAAGAEVYVIDVKRIKAVAILNALVAALKGRDLIAHNAPFDLAFLLHSFGYVHDGLVFDTLVLDGMLFYATGPRVEQAGWKGFTTQAKDAGYKRSLAVVASDRLGRELDKEERVSNWGGELSPEMIDYAGRDAEILLPLKQILVLDLEEIGLGSVVDLEARFTPAMSYVRGFKLDVEGWREHANRTADALKRAREECDRLAPAPPEGITWAWNSSNHRKVGLALELLGVQVERRAGTGNYVTEEEALKAIQEPEAARALAEAILEYRSHEKYTTTWGENWFREPMVSKRTGRIPSGKPDHQIVVDGRVYSRFNQLVATGRGSSKQPNLQNLPPDLRRYFVAPEGRKLLIADYSQLEYCVAAHLAADDALLEPLREGRDFHTVTAEMIGVERAQAKTVNFGVLYGMGPNSLGKRLGVDKEKAQEYIDALFERAPGLRHWYREVCNNARDGMNHATTVLGRRRLLDMSLSRFAVGHWEANRSQALNHPIQGSCADGYKLAAAMVHERRREFAGTPYLVNMVHDELVLETDEGAAEHDAGLLEEIMLAGMRQAIGDAPVSVEVIVADNWGEKS